METIKYINYIVSILFFICYFYQFIYVFIPFVKKEKKAENAALHQYAVLISARNEAAVISQLVLSIKNQTYPSELVDVFVVADNCTDNTADKAREAGAYVWERKSKNLIGKGYALDFLYNKIIKEFGKDRYDGFFVFDADNLLDPNYIAEMNKTFSEGYRIITSYRNSKNYGDNWISAGYGLWFLRESKYLNNSRMLLGTSCAVSGTGFLFHKDVIKKSNGWKYFLLTEDIEFTVSNIIAGEKIGYCDSAVVYDEQPVKFEQSWKQRMRWAKGFLQVFRNYGGTLIKSIFKNKSFACYDMAMTIVPALFLSALVIIIDFIAMACSINTPSNALEYAEMIFSAAVNMYLIVFSLGAITTATEWKNINCPAHKKVFYVFSFPIFLFTYVPITLVALFKNVTWEHIDHRDSKTIEDVCKTEKC